MSSSTKDTILRTLRTQGKCTVKELAEAASISPVSVRHHLSNLMADRLVEVEETRHGVGRPLHMYSLTESGIELSPSRYYRLTNRILEEIKDTMPAETVEHLLSAVATSMFDTRAGHLANLPFEERLKGLIELLTEEGFEADLELREDSVLIRELSCPYFRIGKSHPEVCVIDQKFIASALAVPVERVACVLDGDNLCTFSVEIDQQTQEVVQHDG